MKTINHLRPIKVILAIMASSVLLSCAEAETGNEEGNIPPEETETVNPPLQLIEEGETLDILCIGNSLTSDSVEHLPRIFKEMGITNINLDVIYHGEVAAFVEIAEVFLGTDRFTVSPVIMYNPCISL